MKVISVNDASGITSVDSETKLSQQNIALSQQEILNHKSLMSSMVYRELDINPISEQEILEQLHANLAHLEDLSTRMQFMMREVRYLIKA